MTTTAEGVIEWRRSTARFPQQIKLSTGSTTCSASTGPGPQALLERIVGRSIGVAAGAGRARSIGNGSKTLRELRSLLDTGFPIATRGSSGGGTSIWTGSTRGIQSDHAKKLARILVALEAASKPDELNLPSFKLHPLKGKLKGYWSVWVDGNGRITLRFVATDVTEIDYVNCH